MRKLLFVFSACCSLNLVCAIGNSGFVIGPRQEFGEGRRIREVMGDTASNDTLVNSQERGDFIVADNLADVVPNPGRQSQENFDLVEAPKVPYQHVNVLKTCCSLAYEGPFGLKEDQEGEVMKLRGMELFYKGKGTNDTDKFAGFVKEVSYKVDDNSDSINTMIVSFPGTRAGKLKEFISDVKADLFAFGEDGGFVNSLHREGVAVHSVFAEEVMWFYANMLRAIRKCIQEEGEVREIHFTGHSKDGGEAILTALKFASDIKGEISGGGNVPWTFRYVFEDEAPAVFSSFRSVFGRDNAIKVFTFSAPAVINKDGKDLFYEIIGRRNAVCIFKNLDIVPDLPYLAGKGLRPIGIQANISKGSEPNYQEGIENTVESCRKGGWEISESVMDLIMSSHKLDDFSKELVWMIMRRIKGNYDEEGPNMDESIMGMDREPFFRQFMIWKR